ncbi:MAG TPA: peptide chain release factor 2 [Terriglobales bacterium]|nr:peptide chain release factor 2 [Terriglobales bacterium]
MFGGIFDLETKESRIAVVDQEMSAPSFWDDSRRAQSLVQERADLARTIGRFKDLARHAEDLRVLWDMAIEAGDESETPGIEQELATLRKDLEAFSVKIVLSGPQDRKNAILSIHPGAGGTESQDWAQMLTRMYLRWAERAGIKAEVVDLLPGEEAGIKSATIEMTGEYAYGYLKSEIGVHRLIRISPFDASKRRHTSFASVSVIPEVEDVEVVVKDEELRIDVYRSSGPGGQGVNTADSAVRITHLPSGIVVACQNERSQLRNRDTAMRILKSRLYQIYEKKQREELAELTGEKKEIAFGSQIRTYTFHPYQIIKDHRTGVEVGNVDAVMDGEIDAFIQAFLASGKSA